MATVATADLVGWWPLNGSVDQRAGEALTSSLLGDATFDDSSPSPLGGRALRLGSGNRDGFQVDADPALDVDEFTLGYFINQDGAAQEGAGLERLSSREGDTFETAIGDASAVGGTSSSTGTTLSYFQGSWNVTDVEIPEAEWVHVVWKNTPDEIQLYLNGALEYTGPAAAPGAVTGFMNIGVRHNNVEGFEGLIDDFFLWDDSENPLTPQAIASIASEGMSAFLGFDKDSDGDGLPDFWETDNGLDPEDDGAGDVANGAEGDPDGDGLNNEGEFENGTLAKDDDSDDDGVKDNDEILAGTNPLNPDSDGDGLSDGAEIAAGTKPLEPDTDKDGFLDGFELENGSDPLDVASVPGMGSLLVVHLTFDGVLDDESGNGNDGVAIGEPTFDDAVPDGLGGQSLRLPEGDVDGVTVEANDLLNSSPFTLAYFINPEGSLQGNAGLERLTSRAGDGFETAIGDANAVGGTDSETGLTLSYYEGTGWHVTNVAIAPEGWTHVAWRNEGDGPDDMQLFINGILEYTGPGVPAGRLNGLMNIGIRHNNAEGYDGLMDDFRLYAINLTDSDIAAIAAGESGGGNTLAFTGIVHKGTGDEPRSVELKWASQPGRLYTIDFSTDLSDWLELSDSHTSKGDETTYTDDTVVAETSVRFYRVHKN